MKKIIASLVLMGSAISMNAAVNVSRIEPTDWYVGMKDASLQLMVYGKDIKNADVTVDYPGVKVDSIARLDSTKRSSRRLLNLPSLSHLRCLLRRA